MASGGARMKAQKKATPSGAAFSILIAYDIKLSSTAAAAVAVAAAWWTGRGRAEIYAGADFKPVSQIIHGYRFGFFIKFFVHDKLETIHIVYIVGVFWLIQSHCQWWAASSPVI